MTRVITLAEIDPDDFWENPTIYLCEYCDWSLLDWASPGPKDRPRDVYYVEPDGMRVCSECLPDLEF